MVVEFVLWAFSYLAQIFSNLLFLHLCSWLFPKEVKKELQILVWGLSAPSLSHFDIRLAVGILESVSAGRRWCVDTVQDIHHRLPICSCACFSTWGGGVAPWGGLWSRSLECKFNWKVQAGRTMGFVGWKVVTSEWVQHKSLSVSCSLSSGKIFFKLLCIANICIELPFCLLFFDWNAQCLNISLIYFVCYAKLKTLKNSRNGFKYHWDRQLPELVVWGVSHVLALTHLFLGFPIIWEGRRNE